MRHAYLLPVTFVFVFATAAAHAQYEVDSLLFKQTMLGVYKKKLVMEHFDLTEAEKAAFWPLYEEYSATIRDIEMESLEILNICADGGKKLANEELEFLSKRILQNDVMLAKFRKQYYRKFKQALSTDLATAFMQFDNSFRTVLRWEVQRNAAPQEVAHAANSTLQTRAK